MSLVPRRTYYRDPYAMDVSDPYQEFRHFGGPFAYSTLPPPPPPPLRPHFPAETSPLVNATINWKDTPTAHVFTIDLPGIKKEQLTVDLEDGRVLKISGELGTIEKEDKSGKWVRIERIGGRFVRSFVLPDDCKPNETEAYMENGVLIIKVPKAEMRNVPPQVRRISLR